MKLQINTIELFTGLTTLLPIVPTKIKEGYLDYYNKVILTLFEDGFSVAYTNGHFAVIKDYTKTAMREENLGVILLDKALIKDLLNKVQTDYIQVNIEGEKVTMEINQFAVILLRTDKFNIFSCLPKPETLGKLTLELDIRDFTTALDNASKEIKTAIKNEPKSKGLQPDETFAYLKQTDIGFQLEAQSYIEQVIFSSTKMVKVKTTNIVTGQRKYSLETLQTPLNLLRFDRRVTLDFSGSSMLYTKNGNTTIMCMGVMDINFNTFGIANYYTPFCTAEQYQLHSLIKAIKDYLVIEPSGNESNDFAYTISRIMDRVRQRGYQQGVAIPDDDFNKYFLEYYGYEAFEKWQELIVKYNHYQANN